MIKNNNIDIQIDEPVMLININREYRDDLTDDQLYEVTRSAWNVSLDRAQKAEYGKKAPNEIRNKYLDGSVAGYRKLGSRNPILYVNC